MAAVCGRCGAPNLSEYGDVCDDCLEEEQDRTYADADPDAYALAVWLDGPYGDRFTDYPGDLL